MIDKLIAHHQDSLISVVKTINDNALGIAFIVDEHNRLCGTVTDGDIRRALLNNLKLDTQVACIVGEEYVYGTVGDSYESLLQKISDKVKIIPLVDEQHHIVDFFEYKQDYYFPVAIPNLNGNEFKYLTDAFMSSWISSSGEYIDQFEQNFAAYCDCEHGIAVSNGTAALHLALVALGIKPGDEVIVPDLTFAATINTVLHAQATPVIVDVDKDSWCIDTKEIIKAITPKTKAIIPVHLYGQVCDMQSIMEIAEHYHLKVIEDCAEAHGAQYANRKVGGFGDIGCFSFFGNKVITTGEGGMCTTNQPQLNEKMRVLRDHGMSKTKRYWHDVVGFNYRMTNLQAAIGLAQLERIEDIHKNRRRYEQSYQRVLGKQNFTFQQDLPNSQRITWLVSVLLHESFNRSDFIAKLKHSGLDSRPFFYPLSDMAIYAPYCSQYTPVAHQVSSAGINFPTYESLKSLEEIEAILENINCT